MKLSESRFGFLLSFPGLLVIILLSFFPTIMLFITSFLRYDNINPITFCAFENYEKMLNDPLFLPSLEKTLVFTFGTTSLTFCVGLILALCLSRITKYSGVFRILMLLPWAVPLVISGFIWKWIFDPVYGVINYLLIKIGLLANPINIFSDPNLAMIGVIVADSWVRIPFMCVILLAGFESIPQDLYEAAKVDGANAFQTFRYISLPLAMPAMATGLMITSMFSFRTIDVICSMTKGGPARATYVIGYFLQDQLYRTLNFGYLSALGIIMLFLQLAIISIFIYYLFKR